MPTKTYYDILGVDQNADSKAIRQAYLRASLKHHPDKNLDRVDEAKAMFIEIGQAYETLSDPTLRAKYDRELSGGVFSSNNRSQQTQQRAYDSYREAFDANVAGMSEAEVRAAMGVAAMVGSVLGSMIGSRMGASNGCNKGGSILSTVGSLAGSMMASQAASEAVLSLHQSSVERLANDDARRAAVGRGEEIPPQEVPLAQKWKEKVKETVEFVKAKHSQQSNQQNGDESQRSNHQHGEQQHSQRSNQQNGDEGSQKRNWKDGFNKAVASAQQKAAVAAMNAAMHSQQSNQQNGDEKYSQRSNHQNGEAQHSQRSNQQNGEQQHSQRSNQQNGDEGSPKQNWKDGFNKAVASAQQKAAVAAMKAAISMQTKKA
jgi:curved DNA-binding protein CbpA